MIGRLVAAPAPVLAAALAAALGPVLASSAHAVPVSARFANTAGCDSISHTFPSAHELGPSNVPAGSGVFAGFPPDESIAMGFATMPAGAPRPCVPEDGNPNNDFIVSITNLSPFVYRDLFLVADTLVDGVPISLGNADGLVYDLSDPASPGGFALRIDATGVNQNLVEADGDGLFEPGELWEIALANFGPGPPILPSAASPGFFAGTSTFANELTNDDVRVPSTLSFVGSRVPEPRSDALIALGLLVLASRSKRSSGD